MQTAATTYRPLMQTLWPVTDATGSRAALRNVFLVIAGAFLLTLSARLKVPFYPVPMTMQTFVVLVLGAVYGSRLGAASVAFYLAIGAAGVPVFADTPERGIGLVYMMGPTGGFLVGFLASALVVGMLAERGWDRSVAWLLAAMAIGHVVIFAFGVAWLAGLLGWSKAWTLGVAPFFLATLLKTALGAAAVSGLWSYADWRSAA